MPPRTATAGLLALLTAFPAAQAAGPQDRIRQTTDKILAILKDPALQSPEQKAERRQKIEAAVDERFNWPEMARRALAIHWRKRTDAERQEFVALFTELVRSTYMKKIEGYSGEQVRYTDERVEGKYARVGVLIVTSKATEIPVVYSMKQYGDQWLVYDVAIEGVRLVSNYRTQFASMLNRMSYEEFVGKLKTKVAELKEE